MKNQPRGSIRSILLLGTAAVLVIAPLQAPGQSNFPNRVIRVDSRLAVPSVWLLHHDFGEKK